MEKKLRTDQEFEELKKKIKIFQVNETDWVAAETLEQAIQCLADTVSDGVVNEAFLEEFVCDTMEMPEASLQKITYSDTDDLDENDLPKEETFRENLDSRIREGDSFPQFFASTEW